MFIKRQKPSSKLFRTNPSDVYILGRNEYAVSASKIINFNSFIDETTSEKQFLNKPIVGFSVLNSRSFVINASTMRPLEASKRISKFTKNQVHVFELLEECEPELRTNVYWREFRKDYANNGSDYLDFENSLCDSESRLLWEDIKYLRLTGKFKNLNKFPRSSGTHYFPNFIKFTKNDEVFYDIGCFDGQTSLDFADHCESYSRIYAFEPNPSNLPIMNKNFVGVRDLEIIQKGLSNSNGKSGFSSNLGSASHFDINSPLQIDLATIDSLNLLPPTFMKLDIEGMERLAIEGGCETIRKYRPKIAVSVYHLFDDIRFIFKQLNELLPDSRFYLRHYSEGIHETVLFCLPNG